MTEDGFLKSIQGSSLTGMGIDLGDFHNALKGGKGAYRGIGEKSFRRDGGVTGDKGNYRRVKDDRGNMGVSDTDSLQRGNIPLHKDFTYRPLTTLYPPLSRIRAEDSTYEIFLELINKTDWLLRGLVASLEKKLHDNQKGYQIVQARIQNKFRN